MKSRVAQWKRAGPITQRSEDQNLALLNSFLFWLMANIFKLLFLNLRKQILHILHYQMIFDERFIFNFISNIFPRVMKKFFFRVRNIR